MRYKVSIKCLIPFQNWTHEESFECEPKQLGTTLRRLYTAFREHKIVVTDRDGRECGAARYGKYLLLNGNRMHIDLEV